MTTRRERVGRLSSAKVWLDAKDVKRFAALYNRGIETFKKDQDAFHKKKVGDVHKKAYQLFVQRIKRPRWSPSAGGSQYGQNRRMTGKFYARGGKEAGGAFRTVTFNEGGMAGFGYPDIGYADQRTNGVWRVLEFGLPPSKHKIPRGFWFESAGPGGKMVPPKRGGDDVFGPAMVNRRKGRTFSAKRNVRTMNRDVEDQRGRFRQGGGIVEKKFIRDAWKMETRGLPRQYIDLFGRSLTRAGFKG